ncbi:MAG: hypothetical protein BRC29_03205 [Nanohaloarchaea archaeon SW_7_43_1]|nr:MAG: hypothetical protein BRC29_03205 [Nanohaloarchaea archaeon SW_7_43_1]
MRKLKLPGRDRTRPRLDENDIRLIKEQGIEKVKHDAERIVERKLEEPESDPMIPTAGNPVYKAMHACNATSREQLFMSHRIQPEKELTDAQIESVKNLLTRWIVREYNFYREEEREKQIKLRDFYSRR